MVEHHLAKVGVAGSNPVFRSIMFKLCRGGGIGRRTGLKILRRVYLRAGSSPALGTIDFFFAPVAQLDRVSDYGSEG